MSEARAGWKAVSAIAGTVGAVGVSGAGAAVAGTTGAIVAGAIWLGGLVLVLVAVLLWQYQQNKHVLKIAKQRQDHQHRMAKLLDDRDFKMKGDDLEVGPPSEGAPPARASRAGDEPDAEAA